MADDVDDLYALAPEEFVAARDALAKRLRADGDKDAAAAVKKLARPTVAAWALNQLPRRDPDVVAAVVEAGAELRRAQRRAVSGVKDAGMASAATARREAVNAAGRAAASILTDAGKDPQTVDREISIALEAATTDPHVAEQLEEGRFAKPPSPESDLGDLMALSLAAVDAGPAPQLARDKAPPDDTSQRRQREQEERVEQARRKATAASKAAVDAEVEATAAVQRAEAADEEAEELRTRAEEAARQAKDLHRRAGEAQAEAHKRRQAATVEAGALAELERS